MSESTVTEAGLRRRLDRLTLRDAHRLRRRLDRARSKRGRPGGQSRGPEALADLLGEFEAAERRAERRSGAVPDLAYPDELPVSGRREEIAEAIESHQVVIVAGETGSGKTTQLPKIALGLGRGVRGTIGHTQPRRIAARSVAERLSDECGTELGEPVGYTVRFQDRTAERTLVKVMTDGILLAEIHDDPMLRQYDTLIIDEAHERSLSIDFLLGYLKRLLPRRPDLKVIITSATIDPDRFSDLFGGAPVIEVSGRTYPVEVRYRPVGEREDGDAMQAISDAVDELCAEGPGDILVFLSGEREIRDTADMLRQRGLRRTEVLPLYGRLSAAEQHKVFQRHTGRRIVLATNVAETSLTVPGITYVVDPGTARISRYSQRLKVQRLPIEPVSRASARQRSGRCGRTADGICLRLYSEEDFESRPEFTDPEILRTNLASVLLQMAALDLGAVEEFPFLDPPDRRALRDGVDLLHELGALRSEGGQRPTPGSAHRLTRIGRDLAQLPVDPRLGRMLLAAGKSGCLREVLVIVSGLSIQDPRERPADNQQAADAKHARFADPDSDFTAFLNLWAYVRRQRKELSGSAFRRMCRDEYLHFLRIREWQDVHAQLRQGVKDLGLSVNEPPADADRVHEALLAGLLSHVGLRDPDGREFLGARQARFAVFPGSALARKPPRWVMAAELVETSRLWARTVARIDPGWVESLAGHLVHRSYSAPHWSKKRGAVMAYERVTLYGIPLVSDRLVGYGRIDPEISRELFIRHGLVQGEWETRHRFFARNRQLLEDVEDLESRVRRRDIRVDDDTLYEFYDRRVGAEAVSGKHFDTWWKRTRRTQPELLDLTVQDLTRDEAESVSEAEFPTEWHSSGDVNLPLTYTFDPGEPLDGITVDVPIESIADVDPTEFAWQVPGHRLELVTALLRTLPRSWRRRLVPAPDYAQRLVDLPLDEGRELVDAVVDGIRRMTGLLVPADAFDPAALPEHLRVTFRVHEGDETVASGKDLDALREQLRPRLRAALSTAAEGVEHPGALRWEFGALPREVETVSHGHTITGYPALIDHGDRVGVRFLDTAEHQSAATVQGVHRLLTLTIPSPAAQVARSLPSRTKLVLTGGPYRDLDQLLQDCFGCAVATLAGTEHVWDADAFQALRERVRADVHDVTVTAAQRTADVIDALGELRGAIDASGPAHRGVVEDLEVWLSWLVYPGFVSETGLEQLAHLPRYLRAARHRLENPVRPVDVEAAADVQDLEARLYELTESMRAYERDRADVRRIRWALEELRVGLFAQHLRTAYPVSVKRVGKQLDALTRTSPRSR